MSQLASYISKYGPVAGPKLYHAVRSRSAYMGANARRRAAIARLTDRLPAAPKLAAATPAGERVALLPFGRDDEAAGGSQALPGAAYASASRP